MEKYFFQQIIQSFVGKVLLEEIVSLSPGEWTYNQFAIGDPEKIILSISFQPEDMEPWKWYSLDICKSPSHRLGCGVTLTEAFINAYSN
jgi:hypothetical protein